MTDLVEVLAQATRADLFDERDAPENQNPTMQNYYRAIIDNHKSLMRNTLDAIAAAGYRVVPVEPTPEMLDAGWVKADAEWIGGARNLPREEIAQLWLAMLAAAPKSTTGG